MANVITTCRILCSVALLFVSALSKEFYVLYIVAGFSDMIDGTVARKTNTVSEFGSSLDTIADFIFVIICLIKLLPIITIPYWTMIWIGLIAMIKTINIVFGFVIQKKLVAEHTIMNKITGLLLFVFPLSLSFIDLRYGAIIICSVATFAAIQEGHFIRIRK